MSIMIMSRVFRMNLGGCNRKLLAVRLADFADDEGRGIYPGVKRLAAETELSERTIQRILGDFVSEGILVVVKEASGRPGQTTRYDFNLSALFTYVPGATGDTVSPVGDEKGVTGEQETGDTSDGDGCHGVTRTVIEPLVEPLTERDAREDLKAEEDPKKIEAAYWDLVKDWPKFGGLSKEPGRRIWHKMTAEKRRLAVERYPGWRALLKADGKSHVPSPQTYLREELWEAVGAPAKPGDQPVRGTLFSRPVAALRLSELLKSARKLPPAPPMIQRIIDAGGEPAQREIGERLEKLGWPSVHALYAKAAERKEIGVPPAIAALSQTFVSVEIGGPVYEAWRRLHKARHWPFLPDAGKLNYLQFPAIPENPPEDVDAAVKAALDAFERSLIGVRGDEHAA